MRIPGFTAESTLRPTREHYPAEHRGRPRGGPVVPQGRGPALLSVCGLECRQICRNTCTRHPGSTACNRCRTTCVNECETPVLR